MEPVIGWKILFSKWGPLTFLHPFRRWFEFILLKLHPPSEGPQFYRASFTGPTYISCWTLLRKTHTEQNRLKRSHEFFLESLQLCCLTFTQPWINRAGDTYWVTSTTFLAPGFSSEASCKYCFLTVAQSQLLSRAEALPVFWFCCPDYWMFGWL